MCRLNGIRNICTHFHILLLRSFFFRFIILSWDSFAFLRLICIASIKSLILNFCSCLCNVFHSTTASNFIQIAWPVPRCAGCRALAIGDCKIGEAQNVAAIVHIPSQWRWFSYRNGYWIHRTSSALLFSAHFDAMECWGRVSIVYAVAGQFCALCIF